MKQICGNCDAFEARADGVSGYCDRFSTMIARAADQEPMGARCFAPAVLDFDLESAPAEDDKPAELSPADLALSEVRLASRDLIGASRGMLAFLEFFPEVLESGWAGDLRKALEKAEGFMA